MNKIERIAQLIGKNFHIPKMSEKTMLQVIEYYDAFEEMFVTEKTKENLTNCFINGLPEKEIFLINNYDETIYCFAHYDNRKNKDIEENILFIRMNLVGGDIDPFFEGYLERLQSNKPILLARTIFVQSALMRSLFESKLLDLEDNDVSLKSLSITETLKQFQLFSQCFFSQLARYETCMGVCAKAVDALLDEKVNSDHIRKCMELSIDYLKRCIQCLSQMDSFYEMFEDKYPSTVVFKAQTRTEELIALIDRILKKSESSDQRNDGKYIKSFVLPPAFNVH